MENLQKKEQMYEGKAKKVYATNQEGVVIVDYKDDATAFNGEKKGTIVGKGVINNKMSNYIMKQARSRWRTDTSGRRTERSGNRSQEGFYRTAGSHCKKRSSRQFFQENGR